MTRFTDFSENENGTVTATSRNQTDEPVRFEAAVAERKEGEEEKGNWEGLIGHMMDFQLGEALNISADGEAVIDRSEATAALVEADDGFASTEYQAEAVLDYLDEKGIVTASEDQVVVLKDFENITETGATKMYNNWAAMFSTCIERIDVARDRVKQAKERFEQREKATSGDETNVAPAERMNEIKQEIARIVGNRSASDLTEQERQRVKNLRKQYHFHESMEEVDQLDVTKVADNAEELGMVMERFEMMRSIMRDRREEFRELALGEAIFPEDLVELSEQYSSFLSSMSDTMAPADKMEEQSFGEFLDDIEVGGEPIEQMDQQAQNMADNSLVEQQQQQY